MRSWILVSSRLVSKKFVANAFEVELIITNSATRHHIAEYLQPLEQAHLQFSCFKGRYVLVLIML
jgi:hypothetical protein